MKIFPTVCLIVYVLNTTSYFCADFISFQYNLSVPIYCSDHNLPNLIFCLCYFCLLLAFLYFVVSHQTRWYNKRMLTKGYSVPREFSWIKNHKLIWLALITCWCYFTTWSIWKQMWNYGSLSPNSWFSQCHFQWTKRDGN